MRNKSILAGGLALIMVYVLSWIVPIRNGQTLMELVRRCDSPLGQSAQYLGLAEGCAKVNLLHVLSLLCLPLGVLLIVIWGVLSIVSWTVSKR
jgi:hypothetical protein